LRRADKGDRPPPRNLRRTHRRLSARPRSKVPLSRWRAFHTVFEHPQP